jgi:DNA-binding transcriptional ArsR family regulator
VKVIRDPKAFELLADETRRKMIYLLRAKEASANQLSKELGMTPQAIYHHVRKLLEAGLIEMAREERIGHLVETYYRAAAEIFQLSHGEGGAEVEERMVREALEALPKLGLPVQVDDELVSKAIKLFRKEGSMGLKPDLEEKINSMQDLGFLSKQGVTEFAKFLSMTDRQFEEYAGAARELRDLLKSRLAQPVQELVKQRKAVTT